MALIAIASDKGAPGVTTAALALAAVWPRPVLLAECDQAGGDLVYRFPAAGGGHLDPRRGVLSLAVVARRGMQPRQVWEHVQKLHGGLDVLAGVTNAEQGAGLSLLWGPIGKALAALPQADVIADCGRLGADGPLYDLLVEATTVVLVSKVQVADVIRLRDRAAAFAAAAQSRGRRGFGVGVVVVAEHKKFRAALGEVQHVLGQANAPATVLGGIAHDTKGADLLSGEWGGSLDRTMLIKTAREVAAQLVHSLPPVADQAEAPPGYQAGAHAGPPAPAHAAQQPPGSRAAQQAPGAHAAPRVPGTQQAPAAYAAAPVPPLVGRRHAAPPADTATATAFSAPPAATSYNGQQFGDPQLSGSPLVGAQPGGAQPGGAQPGSAQPGGPQPGGAQPGGPQPGGPQPPRPAGPWQTGQEASRPDPGRQPSWSEPSRQEPGWSEPAWSEPAWSEPGRPQPVPAAAPDLAAVTLSAPPFSAPPVAEAAASGTTAAGPTITGPAISGPIISADAPRTTFSRVLGGRGGTSPGAAQDGVTQSGATQPRARHAAPAGGRPGGNSVFSRPPMPPLTTSPGPADQRIGNTDADSSEEPGWGTAPWQRPGPVDPAGSTSRPGGE